MTTRGSNAVHPIESATLGTYPQMAEARIAFLACN